MNVLGKLTLRNLRLNRKRTIVTIIGIILSAAMITGVSTLVASFQHLFVETTKITDGSHHATFYGVTYENSKYINDHAYTQTTMLSRDFGFARLEGSTDATKPYWLIKSYDAEAFQHLPVTLKEGRFPERESEIVISEAALYEGGVELKLGDQLTLAIGERSDRGTVLSKDHPLAETETLNVHTTKTFTITGIIERPRFEGYDSPGYTAITFLDTTALSPDDVVNVSIVATHPKHIFEQAPKLAEVSGATDVTYNKELLKWMGITKNERAANTMRTVGLIIISLIVIGSVAVIYNAFAISVNERTKQFGMLASIGATKRQIRRMVLWEGVFLGLVSIPLGIGSGIAGIWITIKVVNRIMKESIFGTGIPLTLIVSPETIIVSCLFIMLTILLSVYIPAKRAARVSPIEAIRQQHDIKIKRRAIKTSRLTRRLFGIEGELALKNLKRNKRRYRATLFSLLISIVLYVTFSSFMTYGFVSTDLAYMNIPYDFAVEQHRDSLEETLQFYDEVAALPDVERYAVVRSIVTTAEGMQREQFGSYIQSILDDNEDLFPSSDDGYQVTVNLITVGDTEFQTYAQELGLDIADYTQPDRLNGILINRNVIPLSADFKPLTLQSGDSMTLTELENDENAAPYQFTLHIDTVTDQPPLGVQYAGIQDIHVIVSETVFHRIYEQLHEQSQEMSKYSRMYIDVKENTDHEAFWEQLHAMGTTTSHESELMVYAVKAMQEEIDRTKTIISIFLYGFVSLITLIGVTNIFNTISTNIALRRREFAMLKSVGLTPAGFNKMINYESMFYGLKALLYGLPISILISVLMYRSVTDVFHFSFVLPWKEIGVCIIGVFIIVFVTMLHASSKLKKENIIDALRDENL